MAKHVRWIAHKGKEILFMDTPRVSGEEGIVAWEEMRQEIRKRPGVCLILIDTTDITLGTKTMTALLVAEADNREGVTPCSCPGDRASSTDWTKRRTGWSRSRASARRGRPLHVP